MRTSLLLLPVVLVLAVSSCKKNNEKTTSFTGDPTDYILKKVAYTDSNGHEEYIYTYNNDHFVIHAARLVTRATSTDTAQADFTYSGGRCTSMNYKSTNGTPVTFFFEYDAQGRQNKTTRVLVNGNEEHNYNYDGQQRLTGSTDALIGQNGTTTFAYNSTSTTPESVTWVRPSWTTKIEWTLTTNGDANYLGAIRGLPMEWLTICNGLWYMGSFPHNVTTQIAYSANPGKPLAWQSTDTYAYTYNNAGLPTHITVTSQGFSWGIDLEYEKYK